MIFFVVVSEKTCEPAPGLVVQGLRVGPDLTVPDQVVRLAAALGHQDLHRLDHRALAVAGDLDLVRVAVADALRVDPLHQVVDRGIRPEPLVEEPAQAAPPRPLGGVDRIDPRVVGQPPIKPVQRLGTRGVRQLLVDPPPGRKLVGKPQRVIAQGRCIVDAAEVALRERGLLRVQEPVDRRHERQVAQDVGGELVPRVPGASPQGRQREAQRAVHPGIGRRVVGTPELALHQHVRHGPGDDHEVELGEALRGEDLQRLIADDHRVRVILGDLAPQRALDDGDRRARLLRAHDRAHQVDHLAADLHDVARQVAAQLHEALVGDLRARAAQHVQHLDGDPAVDRLHTKPAGTPEHRRVLRRRAVAPDHDHLVGTRQLACIGLGPRAPGRVAGQLRRAHGPAHGCHHPAALGQVPPAAGRHAGQRRDRSRQRASPLDAPERPVALGDVHGVAQGERGRARGERDHHVAVRSDPGHGLHVLVALQDQRAGIEGPVDVRLEGGLDELLGLLGHRLGEVEQHEALALASRTGQRVRHLALHPRALAGDLLAVGTGLTAPIEGEIDFGRLDLQLGALVGPRRRTLPLCIGVDRRLGRMVPPQRPHRRQRRGPGRRCADDQQHQVDQHSPCDRPDDATGLMRWLDQQCRGILPQANPSPNPSPNPSFSPLRSNRDRWPRNGQPRGVPPVFSSMMGSAARLSGAAPGGTFAPRIGPPIEPDRGPIRLTERAGSLDASGHA